jgi:alpha-1,3-rhamnosyltransferase
MALNNSLVSVIVVTYNSSQFVIETLNSIASQTCGELELIITDDCSKDNTIELCEDWLFANKQRFVYCQIIQVPQNTGIAANCNRGLNAASGHWIKYCAGDDALMPRCIEKNMQFIGENKDVRVLFSYARIYSETFDEKNFLRKIPGKTPTHLINQEITAQSQYRLLLMSDRITFTPSSFIHRQSQLDVGGFNESVKLQEDYPMWLALTRSGIKLYFMEEETVKYRQHEQATNNMVIDYLIKPNYFRTEAFRREYIYPNLPWDVRWDKRFVWYVSQMFNNRFLILNTRFNQIVYTLATCWLNPFKYYLYVKKRAVKELENKEFYL